MTKEEFIEKLKNCPVQASYYYEDILKLANEYMSTSGDYSPKDCFKEFIDKETAKNRAKELLNVGFEQVQKFIALLDYYDDSYYRLNKKGYLENISQCDLENLIEDILYCMDKEEVKNG